MKKIIFFLLILFSCNSSFGNNNIAYIDVQFIIDNSEIGKFYGKKIKLIQNNNNASLKEKEKLIKEKELELNNQKNILKKDEIDKKLKELNEMLKNYQEDRKQIVLNFSNEKKNYSKKVLKILNPILTEYVDKNNIFLVIEKKNILVGKKNLDITGKILNILNEKTKNSNFINEN